MNKLQKLLTYSATAAVIVTIATTPIAANAVRIPKTCQGLNMVYQAKTRNLNAATKAAGKSQKVLNNDEYRCERNAVKLQARYDNADYNYNFLKGQQNGGWAGVAFGGGWGLNGNITLNSRLRALRTQMENISNAQNTLKAQCAVVLKRDQDRLNLALEVSAKAAEEFSAAEKALIACVTVNQYK